MALVKLNLSLVRVRSFLPGEQDSLTSQCLSGGVTMLRTCNEPVTLWHLMALDGPKARFREFVQ